MAFDHEVKVGEIRIFADTKEPLTALVVADRGPAGYRLVPVSPYRVPASDGEMSVGDRVFQLWNACPAAKSFVGRSWLVDTLAPEDVARIRTALKTRAALPAKLGDYERRQLASGGDFRPWRELSPPRVSWWRSAGAWSIAAMLVMGLGVTWLVVREEPTEHLTGRVMTVQMERPEPVQALEAMPAEEPDAEAAVKALPPVDVAVETKAMAPVRVEAAPDVRKLAKAPRMAPAPKLKELESARRVRSDAVVAAKTRAGAREAEVMTMLEQLKGAQRSDGSWGAHPLKDTALAVIALMAHGETSDSQAFGKMLVDGVRYLSEARLEGQKREDVQMAACALCGASFAVRNPNVRTAAERVLASIGDRRSVEAGRDWSGLLVDLTRPAADAGSSARVAAVRPGDDAVADTCILVLKLLKQ